MRTIINGKVFYKGKLHDDLVVVFDECVEAILSVDEYDNYRKTTVDIEEINANGMNVLPGFIDVHIHGYGGNDTMDGKLDIIAKGITSNGVTAFLPTTMTMSMKDISNSLDAIIEYQDLRMTEGALVLGAHLEGPFISRKKKGAQVEKYICAPNKEFVEKYKDVIKIMTVAPEIDGVIEMIREYKDDILFSIGHTAATYNEAVAAFGEGAVSATHLFNAMTGLHHRDPGAAGAALTTDCYVEVIADNLHIHPSLNMLIFKAKGVERLLLITDSIRAGGLDEGKYNLGGQEVTVENGRCTLKGGVFAGSIVKLNEALKNFTLSIGESLANTVTLVTMNQARYLGVDNIMGSLEKGKLSNIVIMNDDYVIEETIVKGKTVYKN